MNISTLRAWLATIPPARFVTAITPLVVIAAGWLATLAARYLPGMPGFTKDQILAWGLAAALAAAGLLHKWLAGRASWEQLQEVKRHSIGVGGSPLDRTDNADIDAVDAEPAVTDLRSEQAKSSEAQNYE